MCEECGCQDKDATKEKNIQINKSVTEVNDIIADQIQQVLKEKEILCVNLMGAPGSGKTTVLEGLIHHMNPAELAVIQGDLESDIDKKRLEKKHVETYQINTHSGCHLTSTMIHKALFNLNLVGKKYLFIENVGNLVCPAGVKIGQHLNIVVSSTTEGADKPKKYPYIFLDASLVALSKYDLADAVEFNEEQYIKDIRNINSKITLVKTSSKKNESFKEIAVYLRHERDHLLGHHHDHS